ncbi:MAG: MFS transporter [Clostridia bacterium]|nr:MFS transporter [Clostridia bacterium]MBR3954212.1 MFS transporter [Clostridia bacterium]
MAKEKKTKDLRPGYVVPKKELSSFAFGAMGQGMIYAMMSSYISDYYVNILQLPMMFVLLLMLLARVWDAINDPLMGIIADRREPTKRGKMKKYILYAAIPIAVLTLLMYASPDMEVMPLMIFTAFVYIFWGMSYTMADVPFWSIPNFMTPHAEERGYVISFTKNLNGIGSAVPEVLFLVAGFTLPSLLGTTGTEFEKQKYFIIAAVTVGIGIVMYVNSYFHINERVIPPVKTRQPGEPSALSRIFKCKPLMLVVAMGVLSSGRYLVQAAAIHVARYAFYIGPELTAAMTEAERNGYIQASISSVKTIFQVCAIVGMFGAMLLMPKLMRKFDYKKIVITTCLLGFVASIFTTLIGWFTNNLYVCTPFILISCIPLGVLNVVSNAMICDCLDYIELETGFRDNGFGSACQGFVNKLGNALATCGIIIMYMVIDIDPAQMYSKDAILTAMDLTRQQNFAMFSLVSLIPGISMLLCSIPMFFYKISGKEKQRIVTELAAKRERESAMSTNSAE